MTVLVDTGPLLSLADRDDPMHAAVRAAWERASGPFVTSIAVVPETCYLLMKYLGPRAERRFLEWWNRGEIVVEPVTSRDRESILAILKRYEDQKFGFSDAALFSLAERLRLPSVLTFDRRHFDVYRPAAFPAWEHLL